MPCASHSFEQWLGGAVEEVVAVLDGRDRRQLPCRDQLFDRHRVETDLPDLALLAQLVESAELFGHRDARIEPVQLIQVDRVAAQPPQTRLAHRAQPLRPPVDVPGVGTGPNDTALGGDQHPGRVRVQGLGDEFLGDRRPVVVGGVDQRHATLDGPAQYGHRVGGVTTRAPVAGAGQLGRAVTEAADGKLAADRESFRSHAMDATCAVHAPWQAGPYALHHHRSRGGRRGHRRAPGRGGTRGRPRRAGRAVRGAARATGCGW